MPVITALLATTASQTVLRQARLGVIQGFAYSPYGWRPCGVDTTAGFNGQRLEPATGGYMLGNGHRLYNPVLMRFTRPDGLSPFGKGGVNAYAYCEGDPVNRIDPDGEFFQWLLNILRPLGSGTVATFTTAAAVKTLPKGLALQGTRVGLGGALVGAAGGGMMLAGASAGATVATVGGVTAGVGAAMRSVPVVREWWAKPDRWQIAEDGARNLFGLGKRKPQVAHEDLIEMRTFIRKGGYERLV